MTKINHAGLYREMPINDEGRGKEELGMFEGVGNESENVIDEYGKRKVGSKIIGAT